MNPSERISVLSAVILALVSALGASCRSVPAASLAPDWPAEPGSYRDVQRASTRRAVLRRDYQEVVEVYATLLSPAWRAAYVAKRRQAGGLSSGELVLLNEEQRRQAAEGPYEVELLVTTHDFRENDLHKGAHSVWRLFLTDGQGTEIEAESVVRDRRPVGVLRADFPDIGDFASAYIARFPRKAELFRPDTAQIVLEMTSPRGSVTLTWKSTNAP